MKKGKPNRTMQAWIDARQRHHLSDAQVQMARELGMNPAKLGKLDNHDQEPWKMPLATPGRRSLPTTASFSLPNRATPTRCGWPTGPETGARVRRSARREHLPGYAGLSALSMTSAATLGERVPSLP